MIWIIGIEVTEIKINFVAIKPNVLQEQVRNKMPIDLSENLQIRLSMGFDRFLLRNVFSVFHRFSWVLNLLLLKTSQLITCS